MAGNSKIHNTVYSTLMLGHLLLDQTPSHYRLSHVHGLGQLSAQIHFLL